MQEVDQDASMSESHLSARCHLQLCDHEVDDYIADQEKSDLAPRYCTDII